MLLIRYEDHSDLKRKIPFSLVCDICRTKESCGNETNWHENLEIQICTEGEGFVFLDGKRTNFFKNDIIVVNSNVIHYTATDTKMKYLCLIIDSDFCKNADIDQNILVFESAFKSNEFLDAVFELVKEYNKPDDICRTAKLKSILLKILIILRENHTVSEKEYSKEKISLKTVKETIKYIRNNYDKKICLSDISKAVMTNKYTLSHEFKKATDRTIIEYTNIYRCKKAAEFISDGKTVSEAARMSGFNNMSFFTKTFKKYIGTLPSEYK